MATITKTFGTKLSSTYTADAIVEIAHFRDMTFDADELTAFYLDSANAVVDVGSFNIGKFPDLDGDETDIEKALALTKAESLSNRVGLRFLARKNNTGNWDEVAEFILMNYGRKDYLDLRARLGYPSRLMEKNDALAVQLVDYGDGLLWDTDFIQIVFACTIQIEKKNDVEALMARISALELALEGKLINLPANTLLGRNANTGVVTQIPQSQFATPAQVSTAIAGIVQSAPAMLDTLNELAAALGNDSNFAATIAASLATKVDLSSAQTIAGAKTFTGFTTLGDNNVGLKCKVITGVTAATQGASVKVAHGLTGSKIVTTTGIINYTTGATVPIPGNQSAYQSIISTDTTDINITNVAGNSVGILSLPFTILIWYRP